jgi:D-beta-D-heptose 7-phosphate kinase/D-beta-D-heptose 1-phosphate adenosyltransferase
MHNLSEAQVLVVGDIMLDNYWEGETSRISPEAPVPVVHVKKQYAKAGGAGNVALNIASLQGQASILSITGQDQAAQQLKQILTEGKVNCIFLEDSSRPTITKLRVLSQHQQLIRTDFEENFQHYEKTPLIDKFKSALPQCQAVILSDYGKGTLSETQALIKAARAAGKIVLVDPKGTDFKRYAGASIITPNLKEFIAVVGPCETTAELEQKGLKLIAECSLDALLVTRGAEGMSLIRPKQPAVHIPTEAREVFDVTGAGDTVIAVLAMGLAAGNEMAFAMKLANVAAGIVVGKVGTATVSPKEMNVALHQQIKVRTGIVTEQEAKKLIELARVEGDKVVMTNGCFDILHAGHVDYLQKAKALGHRLLVAVNTDDSVKRLKGPSRPINSLELRMRVLSVLSMVDWVVPFSEDTPERIINELLPDVLVKGADYTIEQIAGAKAVLANGGEVKTIELTPGCSTTNIIKKAQGETA